MLEILEMNDVEMKSLLTRAGYGHLGCTRNETPYVVPVHFVYNDPDIYLYTTTGMKTEFIAANPLVCLQVEEVRDSTHWRSVIVNGYAEALTSPEEKQNALGFILQDDPDLEPAIARTWIGSFTRSQNEVIYRIRIHHLSGRKTLT
jgi:nitroimidazol reductase NimA-like FMN-containing flavoprotein (pyridoxamine 5'-phosphate oxidase superfamily)